MMMPRAAKVLPHERGQPFLRGYIEGCGRLVEQPEPARNREQTGERETPALTGREICGGQVGEFLKPDGGERARQGLIASPQIPGPELQVFADGQGWFQGVLVAEIMGLFGYAQLGLSSGQLDPARRWTQ